MKKQCTVIALVAAVLMCVGLTACGGGGGGGVTSYAGASSLMGLWEGDDKGGGSRAILYFGNTVNAGTSNAVITTADDYDNLVKQAQSFPTKYGYWISGTDMKLVSADGSSLPIASIHYTLSGNGLTLDSPDLGVSGTFVKVKKPAN